MVSVYFRQLKSNLERDLSLWIYVSKIVNPKPLETHPKLH